MFVDEVAVLAALSLSLRPQQVAGRQVDEAVLLRGGGGGSRSGSDM